jgi:hypothetical protein
VAQSHTVAISEIESIITCENVLPESPGEIEMHEHCPCIGAPIVRMVLPKFNLHGFRCVDCFLCIKFLGCASHVLRCLKSYENCAVTTSRAVCQFPLRSDGAAFLYGLLRTSCARGIEIRNQHTINIEPRDPFDLESDFCAYCLNGTLEASLPSELPIHALTPFVDDLFGCDPFHRVGVVGI